MNKSTVFAIIVVLLWIMPGIVATGAEVVGSATGKLVTTSVGNNSAIVVANQKTLPTPPPAVVPVPPTVIAPRPGGGGGGGGGGGAPMPVPVPPPEPVIELVPEPATEVLPVPVIVTPKTIPPAIIPPVVVEPITEQPTAAVVPVVPVDPDIQPLPSSDKRFVMVGLIAVMTIAGGVAFYIGWRIGR